MYALQILTAQHILYCSQPQTSYLIGKVKLKQTSQHHAQTAASQSIPAGVSQRHIVMPPLPPLPDPKAIAGLPLLPASTVQQNVPFHANMQARSTSLAAQLLPSLPPLPPMQLNASQQTTGPSQPDGSATAVQLMPPPPPRPPNQHFMIAAHALHDLARERQAVQESQQTQALFHAAELEAARIRKHEEHMRTVLQQPTNIEFAGHAPIPAWVISHLMHIRFEFDREIHASNHLHDFQQAAAINARLKQQAQTALYSSSQTKARMIPPKPYMPQQPMLAQHKTSAEHNCQQQYTAQYTASTIGSYGINYQRVIEVRADQIKAMQDKFPGHIVKPLHNNQT